MKNLTQIEKHEKPIKLLKAIMEAEQRIESAEIYLKQIGHSDWFVHRIEVNIKIKNKIQNYYNQHFKI